MDEKNIISILSIIISTFGVIISSWVLHYLKKRFKRDEENKMQQIESEEKSYLYNMVSKYKETIDRTFLSNKSLDLNRSLIILVNKFTDTILTADAIKEMKWLKSGHINIIEIKLKDVSLKRNKNLALSLEKHFNFIIDYTNKNQVDDTAANIFKKRSETKEEMINIFWEFNRKTSKYMRSDIKK